MMKKDKYSLYKNPELWGGPAWTLLHCITYLIHFVLDVIAFHYLFIKSSLH